MDGEIGHGSYRFVSERRYMDSGLFYSFAGAIFRVSRHMMIFWKPCEIWSMFLSMFVGFERVFLVEIRQEQIVVCLDGIIWTTWYFRVLDEFSIEVLGTWFFFLKKGRYGLCFRKNFMFLIGFWWWELAGKRWWSVRT